MVVTKLLPVAAVETAVAFCFPRRFFVLRCIRPFSQPWSLVPAYHKGNDSEDEYCLTNLL